jgi:SEC-C motif
VSLRELSQEIEESPLSKQLVQRVQSLLPADDAELNQWLGDALQRMAHSEFVCGISAAVASGRHVDPRHLARGGIVLAAAEILPEIVMRMPEGEVPEYLLQAAEVNIPRRHKALMLAVIAVWCRVHRSSQFPKKLTELAREMARDCDDDHAIPDWLVSVAVITGDQSLVGILRRTCPAFSRDSEWTKVMIAERGFENMIMAIPKQSILDRFGDGGAEGRLIAHGVSMRRSVARVGRNEPCPCGSGKKYKKCCFEKDQERLRHSTSIEGVTEEELDAAPEAHLSADSFAQLPWERLDRIDPKRLPEPLLKPYFERLLQMGIDDRPVDDFEKVGYSETLHDTWRTTALRAATNRRPDLVERLVAVRRNAGFQDDDLDDIVRLCLLEEDPAQWLAFLEDQMTEAIWNDDDPNPLLHLAQATAYSSHPAIGVFVCRSIAPLLSSEQAATILDELLKARDRLGVLPEDPITDVLDKLVARRSAEAEQSEAEQEALLALDAKRRESRELKADIERTKRELEQRTAELARSALKNSNNPEDDPGVRQLHRKLDGMKSELKIVHDERNAYRRKYQEAQEQIDSLKRRNIPGEMPSETRDTTEDDLLLPEENAGTQPVRLIDFSKSFEQHLHEVPKQIARSTMAMLGRLASGDSKAFEGAVRLKAVPTVTRIRIGIDWRLLFRLLPERIEVVDLIPRQDLERRIKTLTA